MSEMIERVARALAICEGDDFDAMHQNKSEWIETRGHAGGRFRSVNEPRKDDYLCMARAAIEAMREPTVEMVAAAFPCEKDQEFSHEDKCLGAAVCLKLGGAADIGIFEGEAVKQAAFLARDYRIMVDAALALPQEGGER